MAEVLIIGTGGREDSLRRALESSDEVSRVVLCTDVVAGLDEFRGRKPDLVVVGPEVPLIDGVADWLRNEKGIVAFGVGSAVARYEASKAHTADLVQRYGIAAPAGYVSRSGAEDEAYLRKHDPAKVVAKADKAAAGKGVVVADSAEEMVEAVRGMRSGTLFDGAGKDAIVFQERYKGPEFSLMAIVGRNGERYILPYAQDHKRLGDGDSGPNTGGMGAYAPVPETVISVQQRVWAEEELDRFLAASAQDGTPYERGAAFLGFMTPHAGPESRPGLLEVNCRLGDPETQVQLPLLVEAGVDVYRLLRSAAEGNLEIPKLDADKPGRVAITVCLAAAGYPGEVRKGDHIYGLDHLPPGVIAQPAGIKDGRTNGGRVLYLTTTGATLREARDLVYNAIDLDRVGPESGKVGFFGMQVRTDIGGQALELVKK